MFDQLMNFLKAPAQDTKKPADLRVAIAALLLEAAHRDDSFGPDERRVIEHLLTAKFQLSADECAQLMTSTEVKVKDMVQLHPYTHTVFERMEPEERVQVIEMLWEVAYADGVLDPEEDALIRKVAGLIYVEDRERMMARQRVVARMNKKN